MNNKVDRGHQGLAATVSLGLHRRIKAQANISGLEARNKYFRMTKTQKIELQSETIVL